MTEEVKKEKIIEKNDTPKDTGENKKESLNVSGDVDILKNKDKKDFNKTNYKKTDKHSFKKNFRKRAPFKREKPEFEQKILSLRRVTRVMAGGRRFSFSVAMVVGDKKGRVGFGMGKSNDTTLAIEKAVRNAKNNMIKITLKNGVLPYDVMAKYKSSEIVIRPVTGKGLAAGGAVRTVLEFAGVREAGAKILSRSKNHINNAKSTIIALAPFSEKIEVNLSSPDRNKRTFKPRRFNNKFGNQKNLKDNKTSVSSKIEK